MGYNVKDPGVTLVSSIDNWLSNYKNQQLQYSHDQSGMTLLTPDETLFVIGPPRLASTAGYSDFMIAGFVTDFTYTETSMVTPMKSIGSRRHIFAKTNTPVRGSMSRLMLLGNNFFRSLYSMTDLDSPFPDGIKNVAGSNGSSAAFFTNLEENVFHIPFGMGIIYATPGIMESKTVYAGDYFEVCVLESRTTDIRTGLAMIMEQVTFQADRVKPSFVNTSITSEDSNPYSSV